MVDVLTDERLVLAGPSAARAHGWQLPDGDVVLRSVPGVWPFPPHARLAPSVVVALDLAEHPHPDLASLGRAQLEGMASQAEPARHRLPARPGPQRPIVPTGARPRRSRLNASARSEAVLDDRAEQDARHPVALLFVAAETLRRVGIAETLRVRLTRSCRCRSSQYRAAVDRGSAVDSGTRTSGIGLGSPKPLRRTDLAPVGARRRAAREGGANKLLSWSVRSVPVEHLSAVSDHSGLRKAAAGEFFTPEDVGRRLVRSCLRHVDPMHGAPIRIADPFAGDGRLLAWLLEEAATHRPDLLVHEWEVFAFDLFEENVHAALARLRRFNRRESIRVRVHGGARDSLSLPQVPSAFDVVVTNPPWETLRPDPRHLALMGKRDARSYVAGLRLVTDRVRSELSTSASPASAARGWGLNLARPGIEVSLRLLDTGGVAAVLMPAALLADHGSAGMREWILTQYSCIGIAYYPAEAHAFPDVDVPVAALTVVASSPGRRAHRPSVVRFAATSVPTLSRVQLGPTWLKANGWRVPAHIDDDALTALRWMQRHPRLGTYIGRGQSRGLWIGRELDESRDKSMIAEHGTTPFLKGRDIKRFRLDSRTSRWASGNLPSTTAFARLVWRDVSRLSQARRIHASLIPAGPVTGNSLNVMHKYGATPDSELFWWLGMLSSLTCEFQIRALSLTGHVSSGTMKLVAVPSFRGSAQDERLAHLVKQTTDAPREPELNCIESIELELLAAKIMGLPPRHFAAILPTFTAFDASTRRTLAAGFAEYTG